MEIRAAVLGQCGGHRRPYGAGEPLALKALELDPPKPGELLVRIDAAGLCHSDLSVINGDRPRPMPMALGHEASATVLALGSADERQFAVGDRVVLVFLPACGECVPCLSGEGYLCADGAAANGEGRLLQGGVRLHDAGAPVKHHLGVSAFASHAVVDRRSAVKVDADVPPEIAALFGCAVLTGVGAVLNTAGVKAGESLIVYGLGGVGLSALLGALAAGAQPVMAVDPSPEKRALALELGAAQAVAPGEAAGLPRADVVIETVGRAAVLADAYAAARRGGRVVTVGLPNPAEMLSIPAVSLVADAKTLMGSYMGSSIPARDIPRYLALWKAGRLPVERLLTSVSPLSRINALMDELADGRAVRQIVVPD
ncbi:zinc-binding dehydrogenase [Sandaracinobacter sp. RS1-74]|uniref:zinc-binding dehydrogenase n=1 Tax=Sandaracinobacteroides sayramensis TaxID=2913411 RepID=UPI001ED9DC31|nr:zinc-binding dehydrogenase [Sandaracinobacteroides sayramensis]MCG2842173.1 zinc-binding dehydrogenase [Sandaracinobacteroides sayramensis]